MTEEELPCLSDPATLREFAGFLRSRSHILSRHPELLFQQAANEPDASALAKIASARWTAKAENRPWLKELPVAPGERRSSRLLTLQAHEGAVNGCVFDDTGDTLVTVGDDGRACFWDVRTGLLRMWVSHPGRRLLCCAFDTHCKELATGDDCGEVRLWDVASGAPLRSLRAGPITSTAPIPEDRYKTNLGVIACIFVTGQDAVAVVLAREALPLLGYSMPPVWLYVGAELWSSEGRRTGRVRYLSTGGHTVDGKLLVQNDVLPKIVAFDIELQKRADIELRPGEFLLFGDTVSWDGTLVARDAPDTTYPGRSPALYRLDPDSRYASDVPIAVLDPHAQSVSVCRFSSDNRLLATAARDGVVAVWDVQAALDPSARTGASPSPSALKVVDLGFSPDGRHLTWLQSGASLEFGELSSHTLPALQPTVAKRVHSHRVTCLSYSADGKTIFTGGFDHTVRSWHADTLGEGNAIAVDDLVRGISVRADGCLIAVAHYGDLLPQYGPGVSLFEWPGGRHLHTLAGKWSSCWFTAKGGLLLVAGEDLRLVEPDSGLTRRQAPYQGQFISSAGLNRAETAVAFIAAGKVLVWDLVADAVLALHLRPAATPTGCALNPDGSLCLVTSLEGQAYLVDTASLAVVAVWYSDDGLSCCGFHPEEQVIALGSDHGCKTLLRICRR